MHQRIRVGDPLSISGPKRHFAREAAAHCLLLAGGIGITPTRDRYPGSRRRVHASPAGYPVSNPCAGDRSFF
jgi:predicted ferric reductase